MGWFGWWRTFRGGPGAEAKGPVAEARFVVLDTELTGLDERKDDIVSIGAVRMRGGTIEIGGAFHELVNPSAVLDARSVVIHGIMPSQVETKPPIDEVLATFKDYVGGSVLVGHCVAIDLAFLNREARRLTGGPFRNPALDTLSLYGWLRHRFPENPALAASLPGLSLFELARLFDIPVAGAHTALGDAYLTAQLF
ncbi:MAG: 3'-5' exonuclease, partial [Geothrix sp.]|nr:3'-5' exonuclease [Geothrix sp.]